MPDFTIKGHPASVRAKAGTMRSKGELFSTTGDGLAKVTTDGWVSRAADRFRDRFDIEPGRWRDAGADWQTAAGALEGDYDVLGGRETPAEFRDEFQRTGADGRRNWDWENAAPNEGKVPGTERMLDPGETPKLDRIGGDGGQYFGRDGDSFGSRSLPPDRLNFERNPWEVNAEHPSLQDGSVRVEQSQVAPAFGQDGGGLQYRYLDADGRAIPQGELRAGDDPLIRVVQPDGGHGLNAGHAAAGGLAAHGAGSLDRFLDDYLPQAAGQW